MGAEQLRKQRRKAPQWARPALNAQIVSDFKLLRCAVQLVVAHAPHARVRHRLHGCALMYGQGNSLLGT